MGIIIDVLLVAALVAYIIAAAKKGFMLSLLEVVAFVTAIFVAFQCAQPLANGLYDAFLEKSVVESISEALPNGAEAGSYADKAKAVYESLPDFVQNYAEHTGMDVDRVQAEIMKVSFSGKEIATKLNDEVARPLAVTVLTSAAFFVLGAIFIALFQWLAKGINKLFKIPIVGAANAALGGLFGALKGAIFCVFVSFVLVYLAQRSNSEGLHTAVFGSKIIAYIRSINFADILK